MFFLIKKSSALLNKVRIYRNQNLTCLVKNVFENVVFLFLMTRQIFIQGICCCFAADMYDTSCRLGRVRTASLPQEYALARFLQDIENTHPSWTTDTPICQWSGVECNGPTLTRVLWGDRNLRGNPEWELIPKMLVEVYLSYNQLSGSLQFEALPRGLKAFGVADNHFFGTLRWEEIPLEMRKLYLSSNNFSGTLEIGLVPRILCLLDVSNNPRLCGELSSTQLPPGLLERNTLFCKKTRITLSNFPCEDTCHEKTCSIM